MSNDPYSDDSFEFNIILSDCVKQIWDVFIDSFDPPGSESPYGADVIGIELGQENYEKDFSLHTTKFEINVSYKTMGIVRV